MKLVACPAAPAEPELRGTYTADYDVLAAHAVVLAALAARPADLAAYTAKAEPFVEWYEKLRLPRTVRFGAPAEVDDPYCRPRLELIRRYLLLASRYIPVHVLYLPPRNCACPACGTPLPESLHDETGVQVCPTCQAERVLPGKGRTTGSLADDTPPARTYRADNEERENFLKALVRYQGLQKDKLPADLFARLDRYFLSINYPTGEDVLAGRAGAAVLSRDVMYKALSAVNTPVYEHVNLISHMYWGTPLPDLRHLQDTIMLHFDATQRVARLHGIQPVNTQYRLFKHLELVGFPCHAVDFRIPKTREIVQTDEDRWRAMCDGVDASERALGVRFIPTI